MAKEIDRARAGSALAVIKQHPAMVLFALSPALIVLGAVWWLFGARCRGRHEAQVGRGPVRCW